MIKINLLPTKKKAPKKVIDLRQQVILAVLVLILVGIGMGYGWTQLDARIDALTLQKDAVDKKVREQDAMLKDVNNVEGERKKVSDKIDTIEQLKKNQAGPVRLLDELSKALPEGVNLNSFTENSGNVNIDGDAFTNDVIVRFVDNLKAVPNFFDVYLMETVQTPQQGIETYKYKLSFKYKGF